MTLVNPIKGGTQERDRGNLARVDDDYDLMSERE